MKSELTQELIRICGPKFEIEHDRFDQFGIDNLTEEQRIEVEQKLIEHFEFEKIVWMELPSGITEDGNPVVAKSIKLSEDENPKYTGKVGYVYKILFTPKIYNPLDLYTGVKDGCVFAPVLYNPLTFQPTQSITLSWSPEIIQDLDAPPRTLEDDKQMIRDLLEKVLDNPEAYRPEGHRHTIVRFGIDKYKQ